MDLEKLTIAELQEQLISLGMPEDDVAAFKTKAPLIASIKTLLAKEATEKEEVKEEGVQEVKKVASINERPDPMEEREVNKRWKNKAERMKAHLESQKKVRILVPLDPTEQAGVVEWRTDKNGNTYQVHISGAVETVQLNGYKYFIPRGKYVEVPEQIAEVVSNAQQQTLSAGSDISLNRIDPKTGRPFSDVL